MEGAPLNYIGSIRPESLACARAESSSGLTATHRASDKSHIHLQELRQAVDVKVARKRVANRAQERNTLFNRLHTARYGRGRGGGDLVEEKFDRILGVFDHLLETRQIGSSEVVGVHLLAVR